MTADPDLLRVLVAAEAARAKVVLVGDDRQLGPVGPGGALGGLVERSQAVVHVLDENVRQADRGERRALNRLRAGDVDQAVDWYADHGRIATAPTRDEALDAMVDAWLADTRAGLDTGLYAWRRANVAELNRRARAAWAADGHLTGPEVEAPGGRRYAAGDRIVTLAPGADGQTVTSERGVVEHTDPAHGRLIVRMDDGRRHVLDREDTAADRLDHGYAVTVHRAQGATVDVAHRFEDGGGRELAYVSMSRARQRSTVHVVADNLDQAVEDLRRDWSQRAPPPLGHRHRHPHHRPPRRRTRTRRAGRAALVAAPSPPPSRTGRPHGARPARPDPPARPSRVPSRRPAPAAPGPRVRHRQLPARRDRRRRPRASRRRPAANARRARPRRPEPRLANEALLAPRADGCARKPKPSASSPLRAARRAGAHQAHRRPARRRSRRPASYAAKPTTTAPGSAPTPASWTGSAASTTNSAEELRSIEAIDVPQVEPYASDRGLGIEL